ncbi:hypothetical protein MUK42_22126 [Musa troglodytarum]|uniref:Uncharacterized protein n=1 Tax=Musa troglodytarum TaxID=320322 RepID=A0A9E7GCG9_9LILI|nr:hypothetical protein MUK42_22126 [Musa troglodytarum]
MTTAAAAEGADNSSGNSGSCGQQRLKLRTTATTVVEALQGIHWWRRNLRFTTSTVEGTAHGATMEGSYGDRRTHPSMTKEGPVLQAREKREQLRKSRMILEMSLLKLDDALMLFHDFKRQVV